MKRFILGLVVVEVVVGLVFVFLQRNADGDLLSPLGLGNIFHKEIEKKMEVVGFLPTWMIGKTKTYGDEVTQLAFSGIEVNTDGSLLWDAQSNKIYNENYLKLKNSVSSTGGKNIVSIKMFEDKDLDKFMANTSARQKLVKVVKKVVDENGFDGVNIDFEYMSNNQRVLDDDFVSFFDEAKKGGWKEVGVDVFANTIIKGGVERINRLTETVDWVVVMAYDFKRPGSDYVGPVAPMAAEVGQRNIGEIFQKIIEGKLAHEKFIMAYPLYGYQWETVGGEFGAATMTNGYGVTIQYKEGIGYTGGNFDEVSKTPWFAWIEKEQKSKVESRKVGKYWKKFTTHYTIDQWHQAYLENEQSLRIKVEAAIQAQLGGVGYWALGYEGKTDLIKTLNTKL